MATIKDVAREAGASIATVSYYLNHTKPVSKETSNAIQTAIDKLKYSHNMFARNVRTRRNKDIGVILPDLEDSYYVQLFQGIKAYFRDTEYSVRVEFSENVPEFERNIAEDFLKRQVCGLFLVPCQPNSWEFYHNKFISKNIPLVLMDRNIEHLDASFVSFDYYIMMQKMTEELLDKGHRDIYLVSGPDKFTCEADCIRGFTEACEKYGITVTKDICIKTDMSKEDAFRKTVELLKDKNPDAIVATTEPLATGATEGLSVLNDSSQTIPVAAFSEQHWNYYTHSFVSEFVVRAAINLGRTAAKIMERQLAEPCSFKNEHVILNDCSVRAKQDVAENNNEVAVAKQKRIRVLMLFNKQTVALLNMIRNFEKATGIQVEADIKVYEEGYEEIINNYYREKEPYDVVMYAIPWLPTLASKHILQDITAEAKELEDVFLKNSLKYAGGYDEAYYGLPFLYGPHILYYRKDLFNDPGLKAEYEKMSSISLRPPKTLKEFNTIADFFTNETDAVKYGMTISSETNACLVQEVYVRLLAFGAKIFDSQGHVCFESEKTLKAYSSFIESVKCAKPDFRNDNDTTATQAFIRGETAMLISCPVNFIDITDLRKIENTGSVGYQIVPGYAPLLGGTGFGIIRKSKKKEESMQFLRWTCKEQVASYVTLLGGHSAVASSYNNDALLNLYPWLQLYESMSECAKPILPPTLKNGKVIPLIEIDQIVGKWVYKLLDKEIEIAEAIKCTHQELEELVQLYMR